MLGLELGRDNGTSPLHLAEHTGASPEIVIVAAADIDIRDTAGMALSQANNVQNRCQNRVERLNLSAIQG